MFCPKCGASIGIDFEKAKPNDPCYGISVRGVKRCDILEIDKLTTYRCDSLTTLT